MLSESQITDVWEGQLCAEARSLYFGELANRYSTQKQWISGLTVFLSSGAVVTLLSKLPIWLPVALSLLTAVLTTYAISVNLDARIRSMAKFYTEWHRLSHDYSRLWNNVHSDEARAQLDELLRRQLDISELATTDAPNDVKRMDRLLLHVFRLHHLPTA